MYYILLPESLHFQGFQYCLGRNVKPGGFALFKKRHLGYWLRLLHNPVVCEAHLCSDSVVFRKGRKTITGAFDLQNPLPIREFMAMQTEDTLMDYVWDDGLALEYIENQNQTPDLCFAAIRQNGRAIRFVHMPTEAMLEEAVRQNGWALKYITDQSPSLCMLAVRQTPHAIQFVTNQENSIAIMAVHANGRTLKYIRKPTNYILKVALEQNGFAIQYIQNPSKELIAIALQQNPLAKLYTQKTLAK